LGYCRFINTLSDLRDCYEHIDDDDLSEYEAEAKEDLIALCQKIEANKYSDSE